MIWLPPIPHTSIRTKGPMSRQSVEPETVGDPPDFRANHPWWATALEIWNGDSNTLLCGATGVGKSTVLSAIARLALEVDHSCCILATDNVLADRLSGFAIKRLNSSHPLLPQFPPPIMRLPHWPWPQSPLLLIENLERIEAQHAADLDYLLRTSRKHGTRIIATATVPSADHWRRASSSLPLWTSFGSVWQFEKEQSSGSLRIEAVVGHAAGIGALLTSDGPNLDLPAKTTTSLSLVSPRFGEIQDKWVAAAT